MDVIPTLASALAAGALGRHLASRNTRRLPGESEEEYRDRLWTNSGIGAIGGAAAGAAIPTLYGMIPGGGGGGVADKMLGGLGSVADSVGAPALITGTSGGILGYGYDKTKNLSKVLEANNSVSVGRDSVNTALKSVETAKDVYGTGAKEFAAAEAAHNKAVADYTAAQSELAAAKRSAPGRTVKRIGLGAGLGALIGFGGEALANRWIK